MGRNAIKGITDEYVFAKIKLYEWDTQAMFYVLALRRYILKCVQVVLIVF